MYELNKYSRHNKETKLHGRKVSADEKTNWNLCNKTNYFVANFYLRVNDKS